MTDYTLVLNAGSSSLKFSVYGRPEGEAWRLESRGQIEGIGTVPQFSAKDAAGASLAKGRSAASGASGTSTFTRARTVRVACHSWLSSGFLIPAR